MVQVVVHVLVTCTLLFAVFRYYLREEDMEQIETAENPKVTLERLLVSRDLPCAMRSIQQGRFA